MAAMYMVKLFIINTVMEKCPNTYLLSRKKKKKKKSTFYDVFTVHFSVVFTWSCE